MDFSYFNFKLKYINNEIFKTVTSSFKIFVNQFKVII